MSNKRTAGEQGVTVPAPENGRRYGGKTAPERRAERREQLLDAGLELFGTRGYAATTIEQVCATAQLNARYFYEEFKSRDLLLKAVYDRHVESVFKAVVTAAAASPPEPRARLQAALEAFVSRTLADERAARINYFEMVGVSQQLEQRRREVLRVYVDVVAAQISELEPGFALPDSNLHMAAVALVSATDGLIIDWLSAPDAGSRDEIITTLTDLFTQAIS